MLYSGCMPKLASGRIHQASELNARYRQILDEAKAVGLARLRDSDGTAIVILPEREIEAFEERRTAYELIAGAMRNFLTVDLAVTSGRRPGRVELGDWPWLKVFDGEDLSEFLAELREAIAEALPELDATPVRDTVAAWRRTAEALSDPLSRQTLLGRSSPEDYVEVTRPE